MKIVAILAPGLAVALALAQTPAAPPAAKPAPAPAKPAAPKPVSQVDSVIQLVKSGVPESLIIKSLQKTNKPANLSPADMVKLKQANVSDNVIGVMMDPSSAPAAAPPPAPAPVAAPVVAVSSAPEVAAAGAPPSTPAPVPTEKKRVVVDDFDYSTVKTQVQAVFGTEQNIGHGIRAMLQVRVAKDGKVILLERAKIKEIEGEQDRNAGNRVKQGSGARVGRIRGADAMLTGDIVIFGRDDKKKTVKGGGMIGGAIGGIMSAKSEDKAVVAIDYRLVDYETSEIIATGEARGESVRKSKGLGGIAGALGKGVAGVQVDMTSSNFAETIIGEATMDCVNKLADILSQQVETMKAPVREVETTVADVSGSTMVISAGANDGVNVGEIFEIHKILRVVKDPTTQEVLDKVTEKVGEMTITSVRDRIATGTYTGAPAQVGMLARKKLPAGGQK